MARVVVVGLGPAGPEYLTRAAAEVLERVPVRYVRTERHPSSGVAEWTATFDELYERSRSLEEVYAGIVDALARAAAEHAEVVYAVPGSPLVAERSVELLRADGRVAVSVVPGVSFLDLAWDRLGVDPVTAGVRLVDAHRFAVEAAGAPGPLMVAQCDDRLVLSELKLAFGDAPPTRAVVLQRLGLPDEAVFEVPGVDLDRAFEPDHLTAVYLPELAAPVAAELVRFVELVRTLRNRCPWDREQTHRSLTRHLLEEAYEVLEAIEGVPESYPHLEEELGDLLFQVVFHATIAAEQGEFTLADVARGIHDKLVRRHPHVFGDVEVAGADDVVRNWERIKAAERGGRSVMQDVPGHLPALLYALEVLEKAAAAGVAVTLEDWPDDIGTRLLALVEAARTAGVDPEAALRAAAARCRDEVAAAGG